MANKRAEPIPEPTIERHGEGHLCFWDHSRVTIEIRHPEYNEKGLWVEILARLDDLIIHQARINLLNQYAVNDFQAVCFNRDGQVNWASHLIALIEPLKQLLQHPPADDDALGWQILTLADIYQPEPPLEYVVADTLPRPALGMVYGAPGSLKSLLVADMLVCAAAGQPWLPPLPDEQGLVRAKAVAQCPALWLDFDNGRRRTKARLAALARARALPADTPLYCVTMPSPWLDASTYVGLAPVINVIQQTHAKLVALDSFFDIKGDLEENPTFHRI